MERCLFEPIDQRRCRRMQLIRESVSDWRIQPDDTLTTILDFRAFGTMRLEVMRLEMAVNDGV